MTLPRRRFGVAANPVLVKELRTRMRGVRAFWIVGGYVAILATGLILVYYGYVSSWANLRDLPDGGRSLPRASAAGHALFVTLLCTQAVLIALIAPALTSGAIAGEREQHSYDL